MNELIKIRDVSQQYGLTTRTLRYYEQVELITSTRSPDYAYRLYDAYAVKRIKQIIVLRKMQISLKDIKQILEDEHAATTVDVFIHKLDQLDEEIAALWDLKRIVTAFIQHLQAQTVSSATLDLLYDKLADKADTKALPPTVKEQTTMDNLVNTDVKLNELRNVRIVHLPPMRIASYRAHSDSPESDAWQVMLPYYKENLRNTRGVRSFGFNNPCPDGEHPEYGYEIWYSIPDHVDIPKPLEEKSFNGGLYAVHVCTLANIGEVWKGLYQWVEKSDQYVPDFSGMYTTRPGLEESLNMEGDFNAETTQLDIFVPIKPKS